MEELNITTTSKEEVYQELLPQIAAVIADEPDAIANMANIVAALKQSLPYFSWVGFYRYDAEANGLVLGPFQGKIACTRIAVGKGVCGTSFAERRTIVVPDVHAFPGHIFCDGDSKSEIVVPLFRGSEVIGVLDVDSHEYNSFDATDQRFLEQLARTISERIV